MAAPTPVPIKQPASGACAAACVVSANNTLGGSGTLADGQAQGYFSSSWYVNNWNYGITTSEPSFSFSTLKSEIDAGRIAIVHASGGSGHWVVAYSYTGNCTSSSDVRVMDPVDAAYKSMSAAWTLSGNNQTPDRIKTVR